MSTISFQGKNLFYRVVGEGAPLLILNGIMMSTQSWIPFEKQFGKEHQLILVDLLDQGQSDPMDQQYDQSIQVDAVIAVLDALDVDKVSILATSYGGEVALQMAVQYPHRIDRMVLANTVARTNAWLREIGDAWNFAAYHPEAYYCTTIPSIYSPAYYDRRKDWMQNRKEVLTQTAFANEDFLQRMIRLTRSAENHDVTDYLHDMDIPTLLIGCEQDHITPLEEQRMMARAMPHAQLVILPETGHAAFYERPMLFTSIVMGFLCHADAQITI